MIRKAELKTTTLWFAAQVALSDTQWLPVRPAKYAASGGRSCSLGGFFCLFLLIFGFFFVFWCFFYLFFFFFNLVFLLQTEKLQTLTKMLRKTIGG